MLLRSSVPLMLLCLLIPFLSAAEKAPKAMSPLAQEKALDKAIERMRALITKQDWAGAKTATQQLLETTASPDVLANKAGAFALAYYNIACFQALLGDAQAAMRSLGQAIAYGYAEQAAMTTDTDLDSLRALPGFRELMQTAAVRGGERTETGTLFLPPDPVIDLGHGARGFVPPEYMDRIALLIPATGLIRERVLILICTKAQRQQLVGLMASKQPVQVTGSGGIFSGEHWDLRFTVRSCAAAPAK